MLFLQIIFSTIAIAASVTSGSYDNSNHKVSPGSLAPKNSPFIANVTSVYDAEKNTSLHVTIGNDKFTMEMDNVYGKKLLWTRDEGSEVVDLIGSAVGLYASHEDTGGNINFTSVSADISKTKADIAFYGYDGELHLVLFKGLNGFYSYFINHNLPHIGSLRTLIRLDPELFQNGHTSLRDRPLPVWPDEFTGQKIFDETWLKSDGTYVTKYDWSVRVLEETFYGVYGNKDNRSYGFWMMLPGRDYYCGDNIKQELTVHRETRTGDTVILNVLHGTHFEGDIFEPVPDNKMWGPFLYYFNDGSVSDAARRYAKEVNNWPYQWLDDRDYQARGSVRGRIVFDDGTPASNLNVYLGRTDNYTMVQGSGYQYSTYTDEEGYFSVSNVRASQKYILQAFPSEWAGKSTKSGDVVGNFTLHDPIQVKVGSVKDLGNLIWNFGSQKTVWQIGTYDRTTSGFAFGAAAYQDFQIEKCPGDLDFYVGKMSDTEWCYGKSKNGTWNIHFSTDTVKDATLYVSFAGYTGNATYIGGNSSYMSVEMNGHSLDRSQTTLLNDKSTYRSSSFAGNWYYNHLPVPKEHLKKGNNTLSFTTSHYVANYGVMWDSIKLVWN